MARLRTTVGVLLLCSGLAAQTFVVDANNGAGANFTDLGAAVAAVPDGATLVVRAGQYGFGTPVVVDGKSLTIFGHPAAYTGSMQVKNLAAHQWCTVRGLQWGINGFPSTGPMTIQSCQGRVLLEECNLSTYALCQLTITQCAQVSLVRSRFGGQVTGTFLTQSDVVAVDSEFRVTSYNLQPNPGMTITGGRTQLVRSVVRGGPSLSGNPGPGILSAGADLVLLGPGSVVAGGAGANAINGSGTVRACANVTFTGAVVPTTIMIDVASTSTGPAPVGGAVTGQLEGTASLFGSLFLGTPRPAIAYPEIAGLSWIEPFHWQTVGLLGTPATVTVSVPNEPWLRGFVFGWQGITWSVADGFVLANPAWFCLF